VLIELVHAEGSVSSTIVIDARGIGSAYEDAVPVLRDIHEGMDAEALGNKLVSKYALIRPSAHPMYDLDYRFYQLIPGHPVGFDWKGSCGHSILASVQAAMKWGWIPGATPGLRIRTFIENSGESLVCEVDYASRGMLNCTAHFIENPERSLRSLLPTGHPVDLLKTTSGEVSVSIVSCGNPYVFVDAADIGLRNEEELFNAGDALLNRLEGIRRTAAFMLGWDPESVFPKIAAIAGFGPECVSLRAISVPSWHPTIALTGAACVGAAASIPGTVVNRAANTGGRQSYRLCIRTSGGKTNVATATTGTSLDDCLLYNSIADKTVHLLGPLPLKKGVRVEWRHLQEVLV
jgi:2-methylaconitate cis-trans-isomerase PrpF